MWSTDEAKTEIVGNKTIAKKTNLILFMHTKLLPKFDNRINIY